MTIHKGKKVVGIFLCLTMLWAFAGCQQQDEPKETNSKAPTETEASDNRDDNSTVDVLITEEGIKFTKFDQTDTWSDSAVQITLNGDTAAASGEGVAVDGSKVTIQQSGSYVLSGTLRDGQIIVEVTKEEKVQLVFNGVDIACSDSAPVYIKSADKVSVTLAEGTVNKLSDGLSYAYADDDDKEPNACLFCKDDLTINGKGTLEVESNYNNGIGSKNDLRIVSGTIKVTALNNGIKGKDSVAILSGNITIDVDGDGIKSDNELESEKGYVYIAGGNITIDAADDGIQAVTGVTVKAGSISIDAGDKQVACKGTKKIEVQIAS